MKRELTFEEIQYIIKFEDKCGVNNLLQEIFATTTEQQVELGKHYKAMCEINKEGQLGEYEVINLKEK